jgi:hypothetical protein
MKSGSPVDFMRIFRTVSFDTDKTVAPPGPLCKTFVPTAWVVF